MRRSGTAEAEGLRLKTELGIAMTASSRDKLNQLLEKMWKKVGSINTKIIKRPVSRAK